MTREEALNLQGLRADTPGHPGATALRTTRPRRITPVTNLSTKAKEPRTGHRPPPNLLPETQTYWPAIIGAISVAVCVAAALVVFLDARRQTAETASIEQGLGLLRLEREVGVAWGHVAITNSEVMFGLSDIEDSEAALVELKRTIERTRDELDSMSPTPTWIDVRDRLLTLSLESLEQLETKRPLSELQAWGWDFTDEFSGVFPSDNQGRWTGLLEATRDAQYMVYSAASYSEVALTRAWDAGMASPRDEHAEQYLSLTLAYLDGLSVVDPEGDSPFEDALDLERAAKVDDAVAATLTRVQTNPIVKTFEADFDYLAGLRPVPWFADAAEVAPYTRLLLDVVDTGGEEVLQRAEFVVQEARLAAGWKGRVAGGGGILLFVVGSALLVAYWRGRARVEATLRAAAEVDPLTGLFNRFALFARAHPELQRVERGGFAVLQIDLDDFKAINDRYGHAAGDLALRSFATACRNAVSGMDAIVARVGGDEFVVLLMGLDSPVDDAQRVSSLIFDGLREPISVADGAFVVRATIGIAHTTSPIHLDELLEQADSALLDAKADGRGRASAFGRNTRRNLIREIGQALEEGHVEPTFQPIVRATDLRIVGLEALARWRREDGTDVPSDDFVRALNALGDHGTWLRTLLDASAITLERLDGHFQGRIWVNVTSADLVRQGPDSLVSLMASTTVPHDRLGIEVMERLCPADITAARSSLKAVRALGVQVALDDLGSDSMPIGHLTELPLDRAKLDGSLISSIDTSEPRQRVLEGLLAIAVNLGLTVVAERVESASEERALVQLGVTYLQGFRYGAASDLDELLPLFTSHERQRRRGVSA